MTKEETISNLKAYLDGDTAIGNIIPLRSVLESAIEYLSEPALPYNLDEAAKDFISGMLANVSPAANQWTTPEIVTAALEIADTLIAQLKQE